ncbi:MAG: Glu-tRNA(Gln) amidotransferase subunit GatD [Candidatus Woesearchaeota archaeon]
MASLSDIPDNSRVHITTRHTSYEGILLPSESDFVVLKLDSGYNIGIDPKHITQAKLVEKQPASDMPEATSKEQDESLPELSILHTGGTIASKVDYETGGVIARFSPEEILELFPELADIARIDSKLLGNMHSDDFNFSHFNTIASEIHRQAKEGQKRFIVTSGTDFLHYLSAALSFMLKDLPVGVLVVGSQRSSDRGSSDAAMNLICAAQFLATAEFHGVGVCMHESTEDNNCLILPGTNTRKMHSSRRDAFKPINTTAYARVDYDNKTVKLLRELPEKRSSSMPGKIEFIGKPGNEDKLKIGMIHSRPHMHAEEFDIYNDYDALVLVGSGLGHFPVSKTEGTGPDNTKIYEKIKELAKKIPVVMSTQTIYGRVHLNVYSPARKIKEAGVKGHLSTMTPETAYIKIAWLASNKTKEQAEELFMTKMIGELDSIPEEAFLNTR